MTWDQFNYSTPLNSQMRFLGISRFLKPTSTIERYTVKVSLIPINAKSNSFQNYAAVYANTSYFYFGGYYSQSIIARLDGSSYKWHRVGNLIQGRRGHNVVHLNGVFLVVGGKETKNTERCVYENNQMKCKSQSPSLKMYCYNPELMTVSDDYCN